MNTNCVAIAEGIKQTTVQWWKTFQKSELFESWTLQVAFTLFLSSFKNCVKSYLLDLYQIVLILATYIGKNLSVKNSRILLIVKLIFFHQWEVSS